MNQQDIFAARERGREGSRRAGERADRKVDGWTERAASALREFSIWSSSEPFLVEEVAYHMGYRVGVPPDGRAWGAATRLASQRGWIRKVGYAPAISSNGSPKCLWQRGTK